MRENQSTMRGMYGSYLIDWRLPHYCQVWYHISLWFLCIFCLRLIACITSSLLGVWGINLSTCRYYSFTAHLQNFKALLLLIILRYITTLQWIIKNISITGSFSMFCQFIFVQCPGSPVFHADFVLLLITIVSFVSPFCFGTICKRI